MKMIEKLTLLFTLFIIYTKICRLISILRVSITIVTNHTGHPGVNKSNVGFGDEDCASCPLLLQ